MREGISDMLDSALHAALAKLSPRSRAALPNHADAEAREAFALVIRSIDPEVIVDLAAHVALQRFFELAGEDEDHGEQPQPALKH